MKKSGLGAIALSALFVGAVCISLSACKKDESPSTPVTSAAAPAAPAPGTAAPAATGDPAPATPTPATPTPAAHPGAIAIADAGAKDASVAVADAGTKPAASANCIPKCQAALQGCITPAPGKLPDAATCTAAFNACEAACR